MGTVTRLVYSKYACAGKQRSREAEYTDRKDSLDDEIVIRFQRPFVSLGEAHVQLLGGVGLVEL